jgi:flavin-dependent dehydrogenase
MILLSFFLLLPLARNEGVNTVVKRLVRGTLAKRIVKAGRELSDNLRVILVEGRDYCGFRAFRELPTVIYFRLRFAVKAPGASAPFAARVGIKRMAHFSPSYFDAPGVVFISVGAAGGMKPAPQ